MQALLAHPAFQAAIAPFIVALVIGLLLRRLGAIGLGLAILGGFLTTVMLTTGLAVQPLTSTRKIILLSLCLPLILFFIELILRKFSANQARWAAVLTIAVPTVLLMIAISWIIWPVISRQDLSETWQVVLRANVYVGMISAAFLAMSRLMQVEKTMPQGVSVFALGLGTAITSMIAASALYAQLAFSVVAAVGCLLLLGLIKAPSTNSEHGIGYLGVFGLYTAAVPLALIGAAGTVYAQLSGWVLLCLVFVPLFAAWPRINISQPWLRMMMTIVLALIPVIPAVWFAWNAAGPISY